MRQLNKSNGAGSRGKPGGKVGLADRFLSGLQDRWMPVILGGSFLAVFGIILLSTQFGMLFSPVNPADFQVGRVAEQDFAVNRDLQYVDETATRLKQEAARMLVPPVFRLNEEITSQILERYQRFQNTFLEVVEEETSPEKIFLRMQLLFPGALGKEEVTLLTGQPYLGGLLDRASTLLSEVLRAGLVNPTDYDQNLFTTDTLELWRWSSGTLEKEVLPLGELLTPKNLPYYLRSRLADLSEENLRLISALVSRFAEENAFPDPEQTQKNRQKAMSEVEPVVGKLYKGQVIIRKGDIVSPVAAERILAVGQYSTAINLNSIAGTLLYLITLFSVSLFLFNHRVIRIRLKRSQVIFLAALIVFTLLMAGILSNVVELPEWLPFTVILPSGAVVLLAAIIINPNVAIVFSFMLALALLPLVGMDVYSFVFSALTGVIATAVTLRAERRIDLLLSALLLSVINWLLLPALVLMRGVQTRWLLPAMGWGLFNGAYCGLLSLGLLPLVEHLLNTPTRFRLRELSDLNAPVFRRMLSLAPGTYSHSISVANLAETACTNIMANALLARVGAYYHDIGKTDQPEYFIENQRAGNKHDELKPSLSAAVIKAHVKLGVEKARELSLPPEVVDIIAQHHGRGVIKYFYNRALENGDARTVSADDYSYQGARPRSREAAVVMLADTVEAASRTFKKPTMAKLEKFVWSVIMEKFTTNELSESDLTLKDLEIIKKSFVQVLGGYFHSRIEYPKAREESRDLSASRRTSR